MRSFNILKLIRFKDWKNYIIPFLLGIIYLAIYMYEIPFIRSIMLIFCFLVMLLSIAAFGYLMNDIYDLSDDTIAQKQNYSSQLSTTVKTFLIIFLLIMALAPWLFLFASYLNFGFFLLQLILLTAYAMPPLRLKKYIHVSIIVDALYNSAIMIFVIFSTFIINTNYILFNNNNLILPLILIWAFLKGIRGIVLHQISDRKNDKKTSIVTFVNHYGPMWCFKLLWFFIFPLEIILFICTIIILSINVFIGLWALILIFIIYLFLFLRLWEKNRIQNFQFKYSIIHIINDLYEEWLPVVFLFYLSLRNPLFLLVLALHFLLFYQIFVKWYYNAKKILSNLKDFFIFFQWKLSLVIRQIIK